MLARAWTHEAVIEEHVGPSIRGPDEHVDEPRCQRDQQALRHALGGVVRDVVRNLVPDDGSDAGLAAADGQDAREDEDVAPTLPSA